MVPIVDLADAADRYRFRRGPPLRMRPDGSLRYENWRDRWTSTLAEAFWPSGSFVVTRIDRDAGTITIGYAP
jgi:hypothetical protein